MRHKQLGNNVLGTNVARPVDLKYWMGIEFIKSSIAPRALQNISSYEDPCSNKLPAFLNKEARQLKDTVTLDTFEGIAKRELYTNMKEPDAS